MDKNLCNCIYEAIKSKDISILNKFIKFFNDDEISVIYKIMDDIQFTTLKEYEILFKMNQKCSNERYINLINILSCIPYIEVNEFIKKIYKSDRYHFSIMRDLTNYLIGLTLYYGLPIENINFLFINYDKREIMVIKKYFNHQLLGNIQDYYLAFAMNLPYNNDIISDILNILSNMKQFEIKMFLYFILALDIKTDPIIIESIFTAFSELFNRTDEIFVYKLGGLDFRSREGFTYLHIYLGLNLKPRFDNVKVLLDSCAGKCDCTNQTAIGLYLENHLYLDSRILEALQDDLKIPQIINVNGNNAELYPIDIYIYRFYSFKNFSTNYKKLKKIYQTINFYIPIIKGLEEKHIPSFVEKFKFDKAF